MYFYLIIGYIFLFNFSFFRVIFVLDNFHYHAKIKYIICMIFFFFFQADQWTIDRNGRLKLDFSISGRGYGNDDITQNCTPAELFRITNQPVEISNKSDVGVVFIDYLIV